MKIRSFYLLLIQLTHSLHVSAMDNLSLLHTRANRNLLLFGMEKKVVRRNHMPLFSERLVSAVLWPWWPLHVGQLSGSSVSDRCPLTPSGSAARHTGWNVPKPSPSPATLVKSILKVQQQQLKVKKGIWWKKVNIIFLPQTDRNKSTFYPNMGNHTNMFMLKASICTPPPHPLFILFLASPSLSFLPTPFQQFQHWLSDSLVLLLVQLCNNNWISQRLRVPVTLVNFHWFKL